MSRPRATQHLGAGPIRRPQPVNTQLVVWGSNPPVTTTDGRRRRQQSQPTRPGEPRQRSPADPVQHPFPEQRQDASTASLTTPPARNTTETKCGLPVKSPFHPMNQPVFSRFRAASRRIWVEDFALTSYFGWSPWTEGWCRFWWHGDPNASATNPSASRAHLAQHFLAESMSTFA